MEQEDLQPQQVNIHQLQPPLWAVCPQHHTRTGSAAPNSLAHLKQPIEQWHRRSQQPDYESMRLLFQTRSPATHQTSSISGEPFQNAASGFVLCRRKPACISHTSIRDLFPRLSSSAHFGKQEKEKSFLSLFAFLMDPLDPSFIKMKG